jgi:hypothetical protein
MLRSPGVPIDYGFHGGREGKNELILLFLELCGMVRGVLGCSDGVRGVLTHWE